MMKKKHAGELYTELLYAIIPTLFPYFLLLDIPTFCLGTRVLKHSAGDVGLSILVYVYMCGIYI